MTKRVSERLAECFSNQLLTEYALIADCIGRWRLNLRFSQLREKECVYFLKVEGHDPHEKPPPEDDDDVPLDDWYDEDEERRKKLFEKEFDDYYEENVHKSAGPVVFVSKMLGMIPVIWTEEQDDSDCKSYYNLYTFIIFAGKHLLCTYLYLHLQIPM